MEPDPKRSRRNTRSRKPVSRDGSGNQSDRARGKEEILIDTTDMFENQTPVQEDGIIIDTIHDKDLLIDAVEEEGSSLTRSMIRN
jgi:hypothetical protein